MSKQPTPQSFFSAVLHTEAQSASLDTLEDTVLGIGGFLCEQAHPTHEAIETIRQSLRIIRRNLKFLLAIQLREATRNLQTHLQHHGQLPVLDLDFEDE